MSRACCTCNDSPGSAPASEPDDRATRLDICAAENVHKAELSLWAFGSPLKLPAFKIGGKKWQARKSPLTMTFDLYGHLLENIEADRADMAKIEAAVRAA